jgi:hypothetical protein
MRVQFLTCKTKLDFINDVFVNPFLSDRQHASTSTTGIKDTSNDTLFLQVFRVLREHERDQETNDVTRSAVFTHDFYNNSCFPYHSAKLAYFFWWY